MSYQTASRITLLCLLWGCGRLRPHISAPPTPAVPAHLARIPPAAARSLYVQGHLCLAEARWADAQAAFEAAWALDPGSPAILRGLAMAADGAGDADTSAALLREAAQLEADP